MLKTKDAEDAIYYELQNWLRWGLGKQYLPAGFKCPLGFMYKSIDKDYDAIPERLPEPINPLAAVEFERLVLALPEKHRQAFTMYQIGRAAVNGVVKIYRGRDEAARLLGVQKSQYHDIVRQAHNIILREMGR